MSGPDLLRRDVDVRSLRGVRHEVEGYARRQGLTGTALYQFVVAVNEIMTNAVRHGGGAGRLRMWRDGERLLCRVSDDGPGIAVGADRAGVPPPDAVSGRGLLLARFGCAQLDVHSAAHGTAVTLTAVLPAGA